VALVMEDEADTSAVAHEESLEPIDHLPADPATDGAADPLDANEIDPSEAIGGVDIDPAEIESPEEDDPDE